MINIKFDEKSIFAFNAEENAVYIFDHEYGRFKGAVHSVGKIEFFDRRQLHQFKEMLDFIVETEEQE